MTPALFTIVKYPLSYDSFPVNMYFTTVKYMLTFLFV